jgi:hypothetical protein
MPSPLSEVLAQTPISKDIANTYFKNCTQNRNEMMSEDTQVAFCSCTSVKMMEAMTLEEIQTMYEETQAGRNMLNKMLIEVYAPCISMPVQDLVGNNCLEDPKFKSLELKSPTHEELCSCISKETGDWLSLRGRLLMKSILEKNPNIQDPIGPVMNSKEFQDQSYQHLTQCMSNK